jgi:MHS family proline/betaine transporter-like MFS transporter
MLFVKETAGASLHGTDIPESEPQDYGSEAITEESEAMDAAGR